MRTLFLKNKLKKYFWASIKSLFFYEKQKNKSWKKKLLSFYFVFFETDSTKTKILQMTFLFFLLQMFYHLLLLLYFWNLLLSPPFNFYTINHFYLIPAFSRFFISTKKKPFEKNSSEMPKLSENTKSRKPKNIQNQKYKIKIIIHYFLFLS